MPPKSTQTASTTITHNLVKNLKTKKIKKIIKLTTRSLIHQDTNCKLIYSAHRLERREKVRLAGEPLCELDECLTIGSNKPARKEIAFLVSNRLFWQKGRSRAQSQHLSSQSGHSLKL